MTIPRPSRRWTIATGLVAASVATGTVVAAQFRQADPAAFQAGLATGHVVRVADIAAADGHPGRGVFAQATDTGQLCLWDAVSASSPERGGGCNPADDPLGGSMLSASLAYEGGPEVESVRDARLVGLAAREVAGVEILMSDGTRRGVRLRAATIGSSALQAFGYRFRSSDLRRGVEPTAVVALDSGGAEVARQPTGIG